MTDEPVNIEQLRADKAAENAANEDPGERALREAEAEAAIEISREESAATEADKDTPIGELIERAKGQDELIENVNPMGVTNEELIASVGQLTITNSKLADYATALRQTVVNLREDLKKAQNEIRTQRATIKNLAKRVK